jgi:hypothetical protein
LEGSPDMSYVNIGRGAPAPIVDTRIAMQSILAQHDHLRTLLYRARAVAEAALLGKASAPNAVASAVNDIRASFEIHLAFEERVLLPLLRSDLPLGPERADQLLYEHAHQRRTLAMLHGEAAALPDLPTLAANLAVLASSLLADIAEEERVLLDS